MVPAGLDGGLKETVKGYWDAEACGTAVASAPKFSREYFDQIEAYRYRHEPQIHAFAQFTRHRGERVLEVGVGAATDFLQWVRAGCQAHGVDLTREGVDHARRRLDVYGLSAEVLAAADAEHLPFSDGIFDVVYSWGVIHHTPDTEKALAEIVRVLRPGGTLKVMVYNRYSLYTFWKWLHHALFSGRPFRSFADVLYHHMESEGTKAYTMGEIRAMVARHPVRVLRMEAPATPYDLKSDRPFLRRFFAYLLACLLGFGRCGWFLTVEGRKEEGR